ncbi:MAG: hypothetical protein J7L23_03865 [Candidatus Diapherotrites archaeon]|nr:hypothetical protein [Candidatus Diapherotrites archaeon]
MKKEFVEKLKKAFLHGDARGLKEISNESAEQAVLSRDKEMVLISLVSYALYKMLTKPHYHYAPGWSDFVKEVVSHLELCIKDPRAIQEALGKRLIEDIAKMDKLHGRFMGDLIERARVKQASRAYAMGLSLDSAAELTGADRFRLYAYIGRTRIHEEIPARSVRDRYERAKEVLG